MYAYLDKRNGEEEERERRKERGKERGLLSRHNHLPKLRAASHTRRAPSASLLSLSPLRL
jgi:hypothetical protein